jgi:hypothetical protein
MRKQRHRDLMAGDTRRKGDLPPVASSAFGAPLPPGHPWRLAPPPQIQRLPGLPPLLTVHPATEEAAKMHRYRRGKMQFVHDATQTGELGEDGEPRRAEAGTLAVTTTATAGTQSELSLLRGKENRGDAEQQLRESGGPYKVSDAAVAAAAAMAAMRRSGADRVLDVDEDAEDANWGRAMRPGPPVITPSAPPHVYLSLQADGHTLLGALTRRQDSSRRFLHVSELRKESAGVADMVPVPRRRRSESLEAGLPDAKRPARGGPRETTVAFLGAEVIRSRFMLRPGERSPAASASGKSRAAKKGKGPRAGRGAGAAFVGSVPLSVPLARAGAGLNSSQGYSSQGSRGKRPPGARPPKSPRRSSVGSAGSDDGRHVRLPLRTGPVGSAFAAKIATSPRRSSAGSIASTVGSGNRKVRAPLRTGPVGSAFPR